MPACIKLIAGITLLILTVGTTAHAFEGDRTGVVLGIGLGYGNISDDLEASHQYPDQILGQRTSNGLVTEPVVGFCFAKRWMVQLSALGVWFERERVPAIAGYRGASISYYTNQTAPSWILRAGVGSVRWTERDYRYFGGVSGTGWLAGVGYEFSPHISAELSLISGVAEDRIDDYNVQVSLRGITLTLRALAY